MRHSRPTLLALTMTLLWTEASHAQPWSVVTTHADQLDSVRVWRLDANGDMTFVQKIAAGSPPYRFHIDPFGRFAVIPVAMPQGGEIQVYAIGTDGRLDLATRRGERGTHVYALEHTLTPDGRYLVNQTERVSGPLQGHWLEVFRIGSDLSLDRTCLYRVAPNGPPRVHRISGPLGSCVLPDGSYSVFLNRRLGIEGTISVLHMTADGVLEDVAQQIDYRAQDVLDGWAVRADQRMLVTGNLITFPATSFAIGDDGLLTEIDVWDIEALGRWDVGSLQFRLGGEVLINSRLLSAAPLSHDGRFFSPAKSFEIAGNLLDAPPAVTPDGRLALTTWQIDTEGLHWGVFTVQDGGETALLADHPMPLLYRGAAIVPPRTEEILGDANADGRVDIQDFVRYERHFDGTVPIRGPLPLARADADQDGDIDRDDQRWVHDRILGL